jgi:hypothetical protein
VYYGSLSSEGNPAGRLVSNRLILSPVSVEIGEFVFAAFGAPLKCPIHPVATGTDPLVLQGINQHSFSSFTLKFKL